jgi:hypothetical protein
MSRLLAPQLRKSVRPMQGLTAWTSAVLEQSSVLSMLDISYLGLTDVDHPCLSDGVSRNRHLRHVNISGNSFAKGAGLVAWPALVRTLCFLNLANAASVELSGELTCEWSLVMLDLLRNKVRSVGTQGIFEALSGNTTLTSLALSTSAFDGTVAAKPSRPMAANVIFAPHECLNEARPHSGMMIRFHVGCHIWPCEYSGSASCDKQYTLMRDQLRIRILMIGGHGEHILKVMEALLLR